MKFLYKTPFFIPFLFPYFLWSKKTTFKTVYLTFDDGPIPEVTPWILDFLQKYNCKATFFTVSKSAGLKLIFDLLIFTFFLLNLSFCFLKLLSYRH